MTFTSRCFYGRITNNLKIKLYSNGWSTLWPLVNSCWQSSLDDKMIFVNNDLKFGGSRDEVDMKD